MAVDKNVNLNLTANDQATPVVKKLTEAVGKLIYRLFSFENIKKYTQLSVEYETALNRLRLQMGDAAKAAADYAEKVQEAIGIDSKDWIGMQSTFAAMANGFGANSEQMEIMSKNLTQLAYDYSSLFGDDVQNAAAKLTSAMSGQVKGLKEYGNNVSSAAMQQTAYARGITESVSSLDAATQAQLRYITIMENAKLSHVFNNMAQTIQSPANMLRILTANIQLLQRAIGNVASAIFQTIYPALMGIVQAATAAANALARLFGYTPFSTSFEDFGLDMEDAAEAAEDVGGGLGGGAKAAKEIAKYLAPFDELNIIPTEKDRNSGGGGGASAGKKGHYDLSLPTYDFLKGLREQSSFLGDFFEPLRNSWDKYGEYVKGAWNSFYRTLESTALYIADVILNIDRQGTFDSMVMNLGRIGTLFDTVLQKLRRTDEETGALKSILQDVDDVVRSASETFGKMIDLTIDWVRNLNLSSLSNAVKDLSGAFTNLAIIINQQMLWAYENVLLPLGKFTIEVTLPALIKTLATVIDILSAALKFLEPYLKAVTPLLAAMFISFKMPQIKLVSNMAKAIGLNATQLKLMGKALGQIALLPFTRNVAGLTDTLRRGLPLFSTLERGFRGLSEFFYISSINLKLYGKSFSESLSKIAWNIKMYSSTSEGVVVNALSTVSRNVAGLSKGFSETLSKIAWNIKLHGKESVSVAGSALSSISSGIAAFASKAALGVSTFASNAASSLSSLFTFISTHLAAIIAGIVALTAVIIAVKKAHDNHVQAILQEHGYDELNARVQSVTQSVESLNQSLKDGEKGAESSYARAAQDLEVLRSTMVDGVIPATDANKKLVENINSYLGDTVLTIDEQNNSVQGVNSSLDEQMAKVRDLAMAEVYYQAMADAQLELIQATKNTNDAYQEWAERADEVIASHWQLSEEVRTGKKTQEEARIAANNWDDALRQLYDTYQASNESTETLINNCVAINGALEDVGATTVDMSNDSINAYIDMQLQAGKTIGEIADILSDGNAEMKADYESYIRERARLTTQGNQTETTQTQNHVSSIAKLVKDSHAQIVADGEKTNAQLEEDAANLSENVQKSYGQMGTGMVGHYKLAGKSILGEGALLNTGMSNYGTKTTEDYMKNMQKEIVNRTASIAAKARAMGARIWEQTKLGTGNGVSVANYFLGGFQGAINNPYSGFFGSLSRLGNRILNTFKSSLSINSPSKATFEIGKFFDEGLINGIDAYSSKAANAAADLGATVTSAMEGSLEPVSFDSMISMPNMDNIGDISASMVQALTANGTLNITVQSILDGKQIGQSVVEYNNGIVKRTGNSPLLV